MTKHKIEGFDVYEYDEARDFFEEVSVSISQWLQIKDAENEWEFDRLKEKVDEYVKAKNIAFSFSKDIFRCNPRVAYNHIKDSHIFIFKYDNDGYTIIIEKS